MMNADCISSLLEKQLIHSNIIIMYTWLLRYIEYALENGRRPTALMPRSKVAAVAANNLIELKRYCEVYSA